MYSKVAKGTILPHFTEAAHEGRPDLDKQPAKCVEQHSPDLVALSCALTVAVYKAEWSPCVVTAQRRYRSHST